MSASATGSAAISRWSLPSRAHWRCTVMSLTLGARFRLLLALRVRGLLGE
jgi:hypothetical protein